MANVITAEVIAMFNALSPEDRSEVLKAVKPQSATAAKIAASGFRVGDTVVISPDSKSAPKKFRGYKFTVTKVCGARLWGDNPDNVDQATGKQINPNKQLWIPIAECTRVEAAPVEVTASAE